MRHCLLIYIWIGLLGKMTTIAQVPGNFTNTRFLETLHHDPSYTSLRNTIIQKYSHSRPGRWGEFVKGVCEDLKTGEKIVALTFDACGGEKGVGYDKELIDYLRKQKIPATLFITGHWIDDHFNDFAELAHDTLFEIENHGLNHRPCSICGESIYGIKGTGNAGEAFDEVEGNARKIQAITGRRPQFYRSATAFTDETCARLLHDLGITPVSYQVLAGDASPNASRKTIAGNVLSHVCPGAILIMHMNHPQRNTCEAMRLIVPELKEMGYRFVQLNKYKLTDRERR